MAKLCYQWAMKAVNSISLFLNIIISLFCRISQENVLIESLLANRSQIGKLGRPVYNASGKWSKSLNESMIMDILNPSFKCDLKIQ